MSRLLIAGNWKMHNNASQASLLVHRLQERVKTSRDVEVVLFPTMLTLQPLSMQIDRRKFRLGAQNAFHADEGAYTGEVSMTMLRELVHYVLIGHSERRHVFGETDAEIAKKVDAALRNEIRPIICIGETKQERRQGETKQVVNDQLTAALKHVDSTQLEDIVIAYEPVWAISGGHDFGKHEVATPSDVAEVVAVIRKNLTTHFGPRVAKRPRILYGGSTNADNARSFLDVDGVSGLLAGGASLNYHQFSSMVESAERKAKED